jgi:hypothetical protein
MPLDILHSHRAQLVLTAVAASVTTLSLLTAYRSYYSKASRRRLNDDALRSVTSNSDPDDIIDVEKPQNNDSHPDHPTTISTLAYDEELLREQLARNYAFFGEEGMTKIRLGSVVVVGCGGVGSWAAVMLVRSCVPMRLSYSCFQRCYLQGSVKNSAR